MIEAAAAADKAAACKEEQGGREKLSKRSAEKIAWVQQQSTEHRPASESITGRRQKAPASKYSCSSSTEQRPAWETIGMERSHPSVGSLLSCNVLPRNTRVMSLRKQVTHISMAEQSNAEKLN